MTRRVLYLWLPDLATDRVARRRPELAGLPLVLTLAEGNRLSVVVVDRAAALAGAAPGQTLSDARSLCPSIRPLPAEPAEDRRALRRLAAWCDRFTPWVGLDPAAGPFEGGLFLDISGCAHLFGGEAALLEKVIRSLCGFGLTARAAVADTPGAAWAWARFGPGDAPILPPGAHRDRLDPLPAAALRLPPAEVETLERLGLATIAALRAQPRAALALRFGETLLRRLDQARGTGGISEPVSPLRPVAPHAVGESHGEPVATPEGVAAGLERLLLALAARLEAEGLGARRLALTLYRTDGSRASATVGTSRPGRDPAHLARLFAPRLETLDPDPGVETLRLEARQTEPFAQDQAALHRPGRSESRAGTEPSRDPNPIRLGDRQVEQLVDRLVDRLANRLGADRVAWAAPVETPLPERQVRLHPALAAGSSREAGSREAGGWAAWDAALRRGPPRPVRLLARPEPAGIATGIAAAGRAGAAESPTAERPPSTLVWRGRPLALAAVTGPERVAGPWWGDALDGTPPERDYWRAEDETGRRLWLFRDRATGRWAVHGLMG